MKGKCDKKGHDFYYTNNDTLKCMYCGLTKSMYSKAYLNTGDKK